ncbi:hypothetical protein [Burkholderia gladioli]|uniref:hypothetical protein n=1 Tax=Burkholderia gladioli TaxID=28095 RepID=UPI0016410035|nr:hypothetical protein [Burkholderia gladioli]
MNLLVVELPGSVIKNSGIESRTINTLFMLAIDCYYDAAICFSKYSDCPARAMRPPTDSERQAAIKKRSDVEAEIEKQYGDSRSIGIFKFHALVDRLLKIDEVSEGKFPQSFLSRERLILARSFVTNINLVARCLYQIKNLSPNNLELPKVISDLAIAFPELYKARNSIQHIDERLQGMAWGKPIVMQDDVGAPLHDSLMGDVYITGAEDGSNAHVSVSVESLYSMHSLLERSINSFEWDGWATVYPI